jgi:hypothetical protein
MACQWAPLVSEKREGEGNADSGGRMLGRGPFLVMGQNVSRGLVPLFLFFSLFCFLIFICEFGKKTLN